MGYLRFTIHFYSRSGFNTVTLANSKYKSSTSHLCMGCLACGSRPLDNKFAFATFLPQIIYKKQIKEAEVCHPELTRSESFKVERFGALRMYEHLMTELAKTPASFLDDRRRWSQGGVGGSTSTMECRRETRDGTHRKMTMTTAIDDIAMAL